MIDVFIAYSHSDLPFKDELKKFLRPLLREERISLWDDFDIEAGQDWDAKIKERLYSADLVLLLVSADSLASDYFYGKEVKVSLERHARGECLVVPIILRPCDWTPTPLGSLEALPEKGRPVTEWTTRDHAFLNVVSGLRRLIEGLESKKQRLSADQEAQRQFQAACLAAEQLYEKRAWAEAKAAYESALAVYQSGFAPDRATLQGRVRDCDEQLRRERLAAPSAVQEPPAVRSALEKPPSAWRRPTRSQVFFLLGVVVVLGAVWGWQSYANSVDEKKRRQEKLLYESPTQAQPPLKETPVQPAPETERGKKQGSATPATDTEAADFAAAKAAGTLPAINNFLAKKYPRGLYAREAAQLAKTLEARVVTLLKDAGKFSEDPTTACNLLRQAATIAPYDKNVQQKQRELGCGGRHTGG